MLLRKAVLGAGWYRGWDLAPDSDNWQKHWQQRCSHESGGPSFFRINGALGLVHLTIWVHPHHLSCHPKDLTDLAQVVGRLVPHWTGQLLVAGICSGALCATNCVGKISFNLVEAEPPPHLACAQTPAVNT